jgi:hypothetical protein
MPRFGIGATTPEEALVIMRPQRLSRMPGRASSVSEMTERIIASKLLRQSAGS